MLPGDSRHATTSLNEIHMLLKWSSLIRDKRNPNARNMGSFNRFRSDLCSKTAVFYFFNISMRISVPVGYHNSGAIKRHKSG